MHSSSSSSAAAASARATEAAAAAGGPSIESEPAPREERTNQEERQQQQHQVNLQQEEEEQPVAACRSEESSSSISVASGALDRSFGSANQTKWPTTSDGSSRQIKDSNQTTATSHRIKVTLSLPRSSTNENHAANQATAAAAAAEKRQDSGQLQQQAAFFDPKRRQSTATLISAAESSSSLLRRPTQTTIQTTAAAPIGAGQSSSSSIGVGLSQSASFVASQCSNLSAIAGAVSGCVDRAVQERELRRIASQRATTRPTSQQQIIVGKQIATDSSQTAELNQTRASRERAAETSARHKQQLDVVPNHKQLAIYINGKIRSNSIFCQSSSISDSFHNIFNRFHHSHPSNSTSDDGEQHDHSVASAEQRVELAAKRRTKTKHRKNNSAPTTATCATAASNAADNGNILGGPNQIRCRIRKFFGKYLPPSHQNNNKKIPGRDCSSDESYEDEDKTQSSKKKENIIANQTTTTTSYKLNPSSMFLRKAMRYYRLWIYCTNVTILLGTLLFIIAVLYVASDYRIPLVINDSGRDDGRPPHRKLSLPDDNDNNNDDNHHDRSHDNIFTTDAIRSFPISFTEPSMIFAYVAVAIQAGILQLIGCFGAVRMKEKFIQLFWYMILALTVLDIVFLVYWLLRYDLMIKSLNEHMKFRLNEHFGSFNHPFIGDNVGKFHHINSRGEGGDFSIEQRIESIKFDKIFTNIINRIQSDSRCCGIISPLDYRRTKWRQVKLKQLENKLNWTMTTTKEDISVRQQSPDQYASLLSRVPLVASSCCRRRETDATMMAEKKRPVILDDSEVPAKVRVPAWAPSSVAEDLQLRNQQHRAKIKQQQQTAANGGKIELDQDEDRDRENEEERAKSLADIIDERWTSSYSPSSSSSVDSYGRSLMEADHGNDNEDIVKLNESNDDSNDDDDDGREQDLRLSKQQRRLLAKQDNYNKLPSLAASAPAPSSFSSRDRRWAVESSVDSQEHVLSRLIEEDEPGDSTNLKDGELVPQRQPPSPDDYEGNRQLVPSGSTTSDKSPANEVDDSGNNVLVVGGRSSSSDGNSLSENEVTPMSKLTSLRRALFVQWKSPSISSRPWSPNDVRHDSAERRKLEPSLALAQNTYTTEANSESDQWREDTFRWPNKLQLNYRQYKTLENYLLDKEETHLSAERAQSAKSIATQTIGNNNDNDNRYRRSIFSSLIGSASIGQQTATTTEAETTMTGQQTERTNTQAQATDHRPTAVEQLRIALEEDHELGCAPRSHFDNSTIYTRGCHEPIRGWLDRSGHILFVTGFCVLSMLKLFSLLLLRLELREMIHKIRVLKGMATEYNALHDLEAYLPRPSVCAQAAELTPSGDTAAALPAASATSAMVGATGGGGGSGRVGQPGRIGGGSFSEAVAAATAAAAAAAANNPQQLSAGPLNCRASSMKTVTTMLTPSMCPRSSSVSAAHLQTLQQRCFTGSTSLRSDLFHQSGCGGGTMSRRHTAVSVCPAAAAAAAAAAHHLMSRRGTYVPTAFPLVSSPLGFHLNQHRHSAHTVHTLSNASNSMMLLLNPSAGNQQQRRPSSTSSAHQQQQHHHYHHRTSLVVAQQQNSPRHYLGDMTRNSGAGTDEAQSSMDSNQSSGRYFLSTSGGCQLEAVPSVSDQKQQQQQQLLYPTFKRQSSTGAQSACNFSLDPRPAASLLAESRRSIH